MRVTLFLCMILCLHPFVQGTFLVPGLGLYGRPSAAAAAAAGATSASIANNLTCATPVERDNADQSFVVFIAATVTERKERRGTTTNVPEANNPQLGWFDSMPFLRPTMGFGYTAGLGPMNIFRGLYDPHSAFVSPSSLLPSSSSPSSLSPFSLSPSFLSPSSLSSPSLSSPSSPSLIFNMEIHAFGVEGKAKVVFTTLSQSSLDIDGCDKSRLGNVLFGDRDIDGDEDAGVVAEVDLSPDAKTIVRVNNPNFSTLQQLAGRGLAVVLPEGNNDAILGRTILGDVVACCNLGYDTQERTLDDLRAPEPDPLEFGPNGVLGPDYY